MNSTTNCPFCAISNGEEPGEIIFEEALALAILDYRPASEGHLLVLPRDHYVDITDLPYEVAAEISAMVRRAVVVQRIALGTPGALILNNNVVDQHVAHHHIHVIPRKVADGISVSIRKKPSVSSDNQRQIADLLRGVSTP